MLLLTLEAVMPGRISVIGRVGIKNVTDMATITDHSQAHTYECTLYDALGHKVRSCSLKHKRQDGAWALTEQAMFLLGVSEEPQLGEPGYVSP